MQDGTIQPPDAFGRTLLVNMAEDRPPWRMQMQAVFRGQESWLIGNDYLCQARAILMCLRKHANSKFVMVGSMSGVGIKQSEIRHFKSLAENKPVLGGVRESCCPTSPTAISDLHIKLLHAMCTCFAIAIAIAVWKLNFQHR